MAFGENRDPESFGRPPEPPEPPPAGPVAHVGQFHADLVLTPILDQEAMLILAGQIGSMVATAVRDGISLGISAALGDAGDDADT